MGSRKSVPFKFVVEKQSASSIDAHLVAQTPEAKPTTASAEVETAAASSDFVLKDSKHVNMHTGESDKAHQRFATGKLCLRKEFAVQAKMRPCLLKTRKIGIQAQSTLINFVSQPTVTASSTQPCKKSVAYPREPTQLPRVEARTPPGPLRRAPAPRFPQPPRPESQALFLPHETSPTTCDIMSVPVFPLPQPPRPGKHLAQRYLAKTVSSQQLLECM